MVKKFLGVEIEIDSNDKKKSKPDGKTVVLASSPAAIPAVVSSADSDKFAQHFDDLMSNANIPGPDYYEFAKITETLRPHIPDETQRLVAAFASLQAQGKVSKEVLLSSASHYIGLIQADRSQFSKLVEDKRVAETESRKDRIESLKKSIDEHKEQIEKLTKELTTFTSEINTLQGELSEVDSRLQENEAGYGRACEAMIARLSADMEKIKTGL